VKNKIQQHTQVVVAYAILMGEKKAQATTLNKNNT